MPNLLTKLIVFLRTFSHALQTYNDHCMFEYHTNTQSSMVLFLLHRNNHIGLVAYTVNAAECSYYREGLHQPWRVVVRHLDFNFPCKKPYIKLISFVSRA